MKVITRPVAVILAIAAPAVLSIYRWTWITHHQITSTILGAGYATCLLFINFFGQVWASLRTKWVERLSNRIDSAASRRISGFERRYLQFVQQTHRFVDQKGLATLGDRTPELNDVFVDVSLATRSPQQVSGHVLSEPPAYVTERRSIWDFLRNRQGSPAVLALIGAPGSGKTTLLRHTAARMCQDSRRLGIPVLLLLRESAALITREPELGLAKVISAHLEGILDPIPAGWFEQQFAAGNCVVMFDGLDEVALQEHRQSVVDWVARQIARYPLNDFLITSRPHGYQEYPLDRAVVLQVRRFTIAQISRFVHGWYLAVERYSTGDADDLAARNASVEAENLLSRLNSTPALADLASNPLLLTMIVNVHRYRGALPGTRAELYAEMCVVLLGRRQQAKKLAETIRMDQKEVVLRELAFTMMTEKVRDLPGDRLTALISSILPRVSISLGPREFLAEIRANGILLELERGIYCFAHHTFQEYLAAAHIRDRNKLYALTSNVGDPWWRETTLLYVARSDAGPVVEACLSAQRISTLTLAFDCVEVASELNPELRARLETVLSHATNPQAPPAQRSLAAAVIASRFFRDTIFLEGGGRAVAKPVRGDLYQLFLSDLGIRFSTRIVDPQLFVNWINRFLEGDNIYRLLTEREVDDPVILSNRNYQGAYYWYSCDAGPDRLKMKVPAGKRDPYAVSYGELLAKAYGDSTGSVAIAATYFLALSLVRFIGDAHTIGLARKSSSPDEAVLVRDLDLALSFANEIAREVANDVSSAGAGSFVMETANLRQANYQNAVLLAQDKIKSEVFAHILRIVFVVHEALDHVLGLDFKFQADGYADLKKVDPYYSIFDLARYRAPALKRALLMAQENANKADIFNASGDSGKVLGVTVGETLNIGRSSLRPGLYPELESLDRYAMDIAFGNASDSIQVVGSLTWILLADAASYFGQRSAAARMAWLRSHFHGLVDSQVRVVMPHLLKSRSETAATDASFHFVDVADGLNAMIQAALSSKVQFTPAHMSFIRLNALAMARISGESDDGRRRASGFLDMAVGITGLERQEHAVDSVRESIALACI